MRWIQKGPEPLSLAKYRQTGNASYADCPCKDDIREALLTEQGYLCAYCMRRIRWVRNRPDITAEEIRSRNMVIEHWYPENLLDKAGKLEYQNMLGVCKGHIDGEEDTCDAKKGGKPITVDPRKREHIDRIAYRIERDRVLMDSQDETIRRDLTERLNLNGNLLPANRKAAYDAFMQKLTGIKKSGTWSVGLLERIRSRYAVPNNEGQLPEYAGMILWWFEKRMRR